MKNIITKKILTSNLVRVTFVVLLLLGIYFVLGRLNRQQGENTGLDSGMELATVSFGMLPYGDHTNAIIGIEKGWFEEVGIKLNYEVLKIEAVVPSLKNKTIDVVSANPGLLIPAFENAPGLQMFVYGDIFQGYAIMARPDQNYKSFQQFLKDGLDTDAAIIATINQIRNKVFAYPSETAIKPFIDLLLEKANLSKASFTPMVMDDPLTVNAMRNRKADFQVGGAPSRITLQKEGFIPLISSYDLAKSAKPSAKSKELASIFPDGWASHKDFISQNHALVLRLASVSFRIAEFINSHEDEALKIHMPFLSQVTGEQFNEQDGKIIYNYLDPFADFAEQRKWYYDTTSPLYYKYITGSNINSFIDGKVFTSSPPDVEDIVYADDIYKELDQLKNQSDSLFQIIENHGALNLRKELKDKYDQAKKHYSIYNYFDAERLANEVVNGF